MNNVRFLSTLVCSRCRFILVDLLLIICQRATKLDDSRRLRLARHAVNKITAILRLFVLEARSDDRPRQRVAGKTSPGSRRYTSLYPVGRRK